MTTYFAGVKLDEGFDFAAKMQKIGELEFFKAEAGDDTTGRESEYRFGVVLKRVWGGRLSYTMPGEVGLPHNLQCTDSLTSTPLSCTRHNTTITITLPTISLSHQWSIPNIKNPTSVKPTEPI